jgi:hypothetical protein
MHCYGKFRGPDFAPMLFLIKTVTHQDLKDKKGSKIPTCIAEWISEQASEEIAKAKVDDEHQILKFISLNPKAPLASIATAMGWVLYTGEPNKMRAKRRVDSLIKAKLVVTAQNEGFQITPKGKKQLDGESKKDEKKQSET